MIVTAVFTAVIGWLTSIVSVLPQAGPWSVDPRDHLYATGFIRLFVPGPTIFLALSILLAWSVALGGVRFTIWVLTLLHVAGGQG